MKDKMNTNSKTFPEKAAMALVSIIWKIMKNIRKTVFIGFCPLQTGKGTTWNFITICKIFVLDNRQC